MRQSEAKDLRSFLEEPVEEIVVEGAEGHLIDAQQTEKVGVLLTSPRETATLWDNATASLHEVRALLTSPLQGAGVRFTTPWEGTGGQLHEVGERFTGPLGSPLGTNQLETSSRTTDDFTLQQTIPIASIPNAGDVGTPLKSPSVGIGSQALRPYRLQRYQSRGVPVALSSSSSVSLKLRPAGTNGQRVTADLTPAPQKIVPGESSPALQSWERRRRDMYVWLVLLLLFLLVALGGIGLDSLIASYR